MRAIPALPARENYPAAVKKTFLISVIAHSLLFGALSWAIPLAPTQKIPKDEGVSINLEQLAQPAPPVAEAPPAPPPPQSAPPPEPEATSEPAPQKTVAKKPEPVRPRQQPVKTSTKKSPDKQQANTAKTASSSPAAPAATKTTQVAQALPPKATNPTPLGGSNTPKPPYPDLARKRNQEGTVRVRCNVDAAGVVTGVSLAQSSGYKLLDEAALKTVSRWKFKPATSGTNQVAGTVVVPVVFKLN